MHRTNEKYPQIMASSFKKSKRYLSDSDSETECDFPRYIIIVSWQDIKLMVRVFANGPEDQGSIPGRVIAKIQKWYLIPPW